jgi:hypothetical protein
LPAVSQIRLRGRIAGDKSRQAGVQRVGNMLLGAPG